MTYFLCIEYTLKRFFRHLIRLVLAEFDTLHSGNAVQLGIRPLELAAWRERHWRGG